MSEGVNYGGKHVTYHMLPPHLLSSSVILLPSFFPSSLSAFFSLCLLPSPD